jgi:outer membrane protein assembly factor BamD (BamD/ComL family)
MKYTLLLLISLVLAGCGKPTAEESFAAGEQSQLKAEDNLGSPAGVQDSLFLLAIHHFEQVVENNPDHPLAESALFRVAELHTNGTRRFTEAIDAYQRFGALFGGSPQAPVSMFMVGFLYNNELHQIDSADAAYRRFLKDYASHELAASARAELDNLGKSPEQIIEQRIASIKEESSDPEQSRKKN